MAKTLDVYRDWLGIQETARPLNFYQLLRLKPFEDSAAKVREHHRKITAHLRKYTEGEFAEQSQQLRHELVRAVLCLTDVRRKREYDTALGRKGAADLKRRTLDEILVAQNALTPEQLAKGQTFAQAAGMELRDALIQTKAAAADAVISAYAESEGLPYVDASDFEVDETFVRQIPAVLARKNSCVPMMVDDDQLLMLAPHQIDPQIEEELRLRIGMPVRTVLCTPAAINGLVDKYYPREMAAAELAGGGPPKAAKSPAREQPAAGSGASKVVAAASKPAPPPVDRYSPEFAKRRRDFALVAFNFVVMIYELVYTIGFDWTWLGVAAGFLIAGIVAGITWKSV